MTRGELQDRLPLVAHSRNSFRAMTASLLTVGDELLIGQIVNTNAAWIGQQLAAVGVEVVRMATVGDDASVIREELGHALERADLVVVTGGLGPTHDDVTKRAVAEALGRPLVFRPNILEEIRRKFEARALRMTQSNRVLAEVPEGFDVLPNAVGTAPGLWFEGDVGGRRRTVVVLPGVPAEMERLVRESVLPRVIAQNGEAALVQKTLLTAGQGESTLAERIGDLGAWLGRRDDGTDLRLAFLPGAGVVRLRLTASGPARAAAEARLEAFERHVRAAIGDALFGEGDDTLEAVVGRMLAERGLTLATAESCTGGRVGDAITNVPGSSAYYRGGVIVYGNSTKIDLAGVDEAALAEDGAVSERVARQLAEGVRQRLGADLGLSTTGIAGPGGGTPEKPVGTVWLGYADERGTYAVRLHFTLDRLLNKRLTTTAALNLVRRQLLRRDRG